MNDCIIIKLYYLISMLNLIMVISILTPKF
jgi:hypothetical protein